VCRSRSGLLFRCWQQVGHVIPDLEVGLSQPRDWLTRKRRALGGTAMDHEEFWALIDSTRGGGCEEHAQRLEARLRALPPDQILAFDRFYSRLAEQSYRWDLWGAAYLLRGGCSDDGFEDFRGWLIGQGRAVFEAALEDPDTLAEHPQVQPVTATTRWDLNVDCEALVFAAAHAYEQVTGESLYEVPEPEPEVQQLLPQDPAGDD
jgi:Protein of unknown function (DUF4240)